MERTSSGDYLITDWMAGKLLLVDQQGQVNTLLDLDQGMADHEFIKESGLLLIPMMMNNKIIAYRFQE